MTQNNSIDTVEVRKDYYRSGALRCETPYVDGKKHGIDKGYYETGALKWEVPYKNGKMHVIKRSYDNDKANIVCLALYDKDREVAFVKI